MASAETRAARLTVAAEIVALVLDCRPVVEADSNGRRSVLEHQVIGNAKAEDDPVPRIRDPQHERVPDRLDVLSMNGGQLGFHGIPEVGDESERRLISMCLRESSEAGDVGEGERGGCAAHRIGKLLVFKASLPRAGCYAASSTLKLNIIPLSWCSAM